MSKSYLLTNRAPGPRGIQTAQNGTLMVQPSLDGASNSVTAILTDDEVKMAKAVGLLVNDDGTDGEITGKQTSNLPAEGQIDFNSEEGQKIYEAAAKIVAERAAKLAAPTTAKAAVKAPVTPQTAPGNPDAPFNAAALSSHAKLDAAATEHEFTFTDEHSTVALKQAALQGHVDAKAKASAEAANSASNV